MSNGVMHIPYNVQTDPYALLSQGIQNMLGPILQREQQKIQQQKMQSDLAAILQYQQAGQKGQFPGLQTPQMQQAAAGGIMGQMFPTKLEEARTTYYKAQATEALTPKEISPSQQISQKQLNRINQLQVKVDAGTATPPEQEALKILIGELRPPAVQVNVGGEPIPSTERQQLVSFEAVKKTAERLKEGFDPKYVGLAAEWTAGIRQAIPKGMSSAEAIWRADLASLIEYMYAISGKQLSDQERKAVQMMFPRGEMTKENFPAVLDNFIARIGDRINISKDVLRQSGFKVPELSAVGEKPIGQMSDEELKKIAGIE